jgi:putative ABC transport system ATP-binding protein
MLKALHLVKDYRVGKETVHALRDVTVEVATGEFLVISGPSGSGKTTLLNLIAGIDRPTAGEVYLEGQPLSKLSDRQLAQLRREKIGRAHSSSRLRGWRSGHAHHASPQRGA